MGLEITSSVKFYPGRQYILFLSYLQLWFNKRCKNTRNASEKEGARGVIEMREVNGN